jgi:hypothetical protein
MCGKSKEQSAEWIAALKELVQDAQSSVQNPKYLFRASTARIIDFEKDSNSSSVAIKSANEIPNAALSSKASSAQNTSFVNKSSSPENNLKAEQKKSRRLTVGQYRLSSERNVVKYVYLPSSYLSSSSFVLDDVFAALEMSIPNITFEVNSSGAVNTWNLYLPEYKKDLGGKSHPDIKNGKYNGALRHYQGVLEENCKRLLKGTATACEQAGAIFSLDSMFDVGDGVDAIAGWLGENNTPRIAMAGPLDYAVDIFDALVSNTHIPQINEDDDGVDSPSHPVLVIDSAPWYSGARLPDQSRGGQNTLPMNNLSHLIICDDVNLLKDKLHKAIPTGQIVIHGGPVTTKNMCSALQDGQPIFLFKYTGGCADLTCETLKNVCI